MIGVVLVICYFVLFGFVCLVFGCFRFVFGCYIVYCSLTAIRLLCTVWVSWFILPFVVLVC